MQKESHNSELLSVQEIVCQLTALLPSFTDDQYQHTLLTCMEQMHRISSRQHYQRDRLQEQCSELTQLIRKRNIEIRSLKKQRKKNSQRYEQVINKDQSEIDRLRRRCDEAQDQLRSLRESRKHSQYQNLLRENKRLHEQLFQLKKHVESSSTQDTIKVSPTELEACRRQVAQLAYKLKQAQKLDRHFEILKEDHNNQSNILKNREKLIEQLQTTVIDQRTIIEEQSQQLREHAEMRNILDDTLGTDDTSIHDETPGELACLLEVEHKEVHKRKRNRRRQHRKPSQTASSTIETAGSETINPDELPPAEPVVPANFKSLLIGLVMSFMMLFSL